MQGERQDPPEQAEGEPAVAAPAAEPPNGEGAPRGGHNAPEEGHCSNAQEGGWHIALQKK